MLTRQSRLLWPPIASPFTGLEVSLFYPSISSGKPVTTHIAHLSVLDKWPEVAPTSISILRHLSQRYIAGSLFGSQFLLLL